MIWRVTVWVAVTLAIVYLGDFAVWEMRQAEGGGVGQVKVSRMVVASLKGNKEEYYADGSTMVDCSKSLFPQVGGGACWWVRRHQVLVER